MYWCESSVLRFHSCDVTAFDRLKQFMDEEAYKFKHLYLMKSFKHVFHAKPPASRGESSEFYWVCMGFKGGLIEPENDSSG